MRINNFRHLRGNKSNQRIIRLLGFLPFCFHLLLILIFGYVLCEKHTATTESNPARLARRLRDPQVPPWPDSGTHVTLFVNDYNSQTRRRK